MRNSQAALQGQQDSPRAYLWLLVSFVFMATLFEGYDVIIINMALPLIADEFEATSEVLGFALSVISIGTIAAFFSVRLADRFGRRPVFLWSVAGYSVFTLLSAFSVGLYDFVCYQFIARMLMVTEIGVGAIILTEELSARYRGMGIVLMFSAATVGGIAGAQLFPIIAGTELGWRLLYLLGSGLLLFLPVIWVQLRETQRWQAERRSGDIDRRPAVTIIKGIRAVFDAAYRKPLIAGSTIWFVTNFWTAIALFFFSYYAINERGWNAEQVGTTMTLGFFASLLGFAAAGPLLDFAGRKFTACLYFVVGGISTILCFRAETDWLISAAYITVLAVYPVWAVSATITSEVFPTAIRGTANAVVNNLIGRIGMVIAPTLVGLLAIPLGSVGTAVALLATLNFITLPVIFRFLEENKGKSLEDISQNRGNSVAGCAHEPRL